jgi:prevent-host-death family protein
MKHRTVTATEFRNKAGQYIDEAAKAPIVITKHNRPARVLLDIDEYERLQAGDLRRAKMKRIGREDHERFGSLYEKLAR